MRRALDYYVFAPFRQMGANARLTLRSRGARIWLALLAVFAVLAFAFGGPATVVFRLWLFVGVLVIGRQQRNERVKPVTGAPGVISAAIAMAIIFVVVALLWPYVR